MRSLLRSSIALALLAPALFLCMQQTRVFASPAAAAPLIAGSAVASSRFGPVTVIVSSSTGTTTSLTVVAGKQTFTFQIPSRDFTQNATSATLNTHGDLKSYGSINLTWQKKTVHVPATTGNGCTGTVTKTKAHNQVTLINPHGTANLHLPCLGAASMNFGQKVTFPKPPAPLKGTGQYQGYVGSLSFTPTTGTVVSLTLHKSANGTGKVDALGYVFKTTAIAGNTSVLPLTNETQQVHTTFAPSKLQIQNDLSSANLSLGPGPKPFKGTSLQMTAVGAAIGMKNTPATKCSPGVKNVGATRTMSVKGTLALQTCAVSNKFTIDSTKTPGTAQLYSSTLKVQAPTPLKVVSVTPADKATNVPTTTTSFTVKYSNQMLDTNATASIQSTSDFHFIQKPTLDSSKKVLTFTFRQGETLKPNTTYTLTVYAQDIFQQSLNPQLKTTFTTASS